MIVKIQEEIGHGVHKIEHSDFASCYTNLLEELGSTKWFKEAVPDSMKSWQVETPDRDPELWGSTMVELYNTLMSKDFKQQLVDFAVTTKAWNQYWGPASGSDLFKRVDIKTDFVRVPTPYIDHPWHCDPKNLVVHGILYLDGPDSADDRGTWFNPDHGIWIDPADPDFGKSIYRVPCHPGTGWVMVNTDRSWHRAVNHSQYPRYCAKFGLVLW